MELYHKIFIALKVIIVILFILSKINTHYNKALGEFVEDIFAIFVGVVIIFVFWPWSERKTNKHDKMFVLSAGVLLLLTKDYYKLYTEGLELLRNILMSVKVPLISV